MLRRSVMHAAIPARGFVRSIRGNMVARYWQQVKRNDGSVYYVNTDTFEKTTEKPHEYVPHEAQESRLVRGLKFDQWGDPLKPVPKWQNYAGYALFASCMGYLLYTITYGKFQESKKVQQDEEARIQRKKKAAALEMARANQKNASA